MEILSTFLLLFFIIAPFSLLFHELGHVIGARANHATSIRITIGTGKSLYQKRIGNVTMVIRHFFIVNSYTETYRDEPLKKFEEIIITIMGPLFSFILSCLAYFLFVVLVHETFFYLLFLFNAWITIINLIPFRIGKRQSDGYTILKNVIKSI